MAMRNCVICGADALVIESRREPAGHVMRRYRCEEDHSHRFVTHEILRESLPSDAETERLTVMLNDALALIHRRRARRPVAA